MFIYISSYICSKLIKIELGIHEISIFFLKQINHNEYWELLMAWKNASPLTPVPCSNLNQSSVWKKNFVIYRNMIFNFNTKKQKFKQDKLFFIINLWK